MVRTLTLMLVLAAVVCVVPAHAAPFSIARVHYDGGGDWYGDPSSLVNLQEYVQRTLGLDVTDKEVTVRLTDDDLFRHPYLYMTGHGNVRFSNEEVTRLREYLLGGGFMHVDDNYGLDDSFRRELKKVFPDRDLVEVPFDHPLYSTVFPFTNGLPKIHEHDGEPAQGFAIINDGRVVLFYSFQCDLGDGWEDLDVHNLTPAKHEAALKMGVNLIAYALSGQPEALP
ncbi:DUF4159 domain-containing protein [bacterium]|nr:DUF4159 domain-containing protein [bacterium]